VKSEFVVTAGSRMVIPELSRQEYAVCSFVAARVSSSSRTR
jgi:hypothetical protein